MNLIPSDQRAGTLPPCGPIPVESSLLLAVTYSFDATLHLQFRTGAIYQYFAVPPAVFQDLLRAESKGTYFNRYIRDCFRYQRLV